MPMVRYYAVDARPAIELHPEHQGERYTLRGIYDGDSTLAAKVTDLQAKGQAAVILSFTAPDESEKFALAARQVVERAPRAGIPQRHTSDWNYVRIVLTILRNVMRKSKEPNWYKELEVDKIHAVGSAIKWSGTIGDVAGSLLSTPIIWHSLPNANHRTNLSVTRLYLQHQGVRWPPWNLQGRGIERFYREINPYIVESKYLLQLIRHRVLVEKAWQCGFGALRIGPRRYATIDPDDFHLNRRKLDRRHWQISHEFIRKLLGSKEHSLDNDAKGGRREFTEWALA